MQKCKKLITLARKAMKLYRLFPLFIMILAGLHCRPVHKPRNAPTAEDVYETRDSIRDDLLLRLSQASLTIGMRAEMRRRQAYSVDDKKAAKLRRDVEQLLKYQSKVEERMEYLQQDSVLGLWYDQVDEMERLLQDASYIIKQPL
jgi:hypothetical protein